MPEAMSRPEFERSLEFSPEKFDAGREAFHNFSKFDPGKKSEEEFDIDAAIEKGRKRLMDATLDPEQFETQESEKEKSQGPWEPFNLEPKQSDIFMNFYNGPHASDLEFNRSRIEDFLKVIGSQNKIIFRDISLKDSKASEVYYNNKLWYINYDAKKSSDSSNGDLREFQKKTNSILNSSLRRILLKEKLGTDYPGNATRHFLTWGGLVVGIGVSAYLGTPIGLTMTGVPLGEYLMLNLLTITDKLIPINGRPDIFGIEGTRILRGFSYLNIKGHDLVRLKEATSD